MKISLSAFVYFNFPLEEAIRRTKAAGFDGIDIWGGRPHCYRRDRTERELVSLRTQIENEGLETVSYIPAQFRYPTSLCSGSDPVRQDSIRYIQDSIENAAILGASVVSVCPGHTLFGQSRQDGLQRLADSLWEISSFAARHRVKIAIEPADSYETDLLNTCAEALTFINQAGFPDLGVLLDNGHEFVVGQDSAQAAKDLGSRLFHVHVDDNNALRDQHLVPGDGKFDFMPFLAGLKTAGYDSYLCAELSWDYTLDPDTAATATARRLRQMLAAG
jgi:protein FrlC